MLAASVLIVTALAAAPLLAESPLHLTVRLYNSSALTSAQVQLARHAAAPIMEDAGLDVTFRLCGSAPSATGVLDRCDDVVKPGEVVVRIIDAPVFNVAVDPRALGVSYVVTATNSGWLATVFGDRIVPAATRLGMDSGALMGLVVAHEVGHLLLGDHSHGERGVMTAEWSDERLRQAPLKWRFSREEAAAIQARLLER